MSWMLIALVACGGGEKDSGGGDTGGGGGGGGGSGYVFSDEASVSDALMASTSPMFGILVSMMMMDPRCPTVTTEGTTTTYTGGCTDENGITYSGTLVMTEGAEGAGSAAYDAWEMDGGGSYFYFDGTLSLSQTPDYITTIATDAFTLIIEDDESSISASYSDYSLTTPFTEAPEMETSIAGTITVEGAGAFTASGSMLTTRDCESEPASGALVFTGANTLTFSPDGASNCDGCTPYTLSDGGSGQICEDASGG